MGAAPEKRNQALYWISQPAVCQSDLTRMLNEFVYFMSGAARATTDEEKRKIFALETKKKQVAVFSLFFELLHIFTVRSERLEEKLRNIFFVNYHH